MWSTKYAIFGCFFFLISTVQKQKTMIGLILLLLLFASNVSAWMGEIHGRVFCDVYGDSSLGLEDDVVEGFSLSLSFQLGFSLTFNGYE